jgi:hypothetical protein
MFTFICYVSIHLEIFVASSDRCIIPIQQCVALTHPPSPGTQIDISGAID